MKRRQLKKYAGWFFISVGVIIAAVAIWVLQNNVRECGKAFQFCKNGWHYDKNFLGQRVDVHYKVDLFSGKKLSTGGIGCGYDGSPRDYDHLIMMVPHIEKVEETDKYIKYRLFNGEIGYLNKQAKPYVDEALTQAVRTLMFKGTSCESIFTEKSP